MTDTERPDSWPERLRAIADWLDLTDPILANLFPQVAPNDPNLPEALECLAGGEMQADLRSLANKIEREMPENNDRIRRT